MKERVNEALEEGVRNYFTSNKSRDFMDIVQYDVSYPYNYHDIIITYHSRNDLSSLYL